MIHTIAGAANHSPPMKSKIALYTIPILFIFGWWSLAFFDKHPSRPEKNFSAIKHRKAFTVPEFSSYLSSFSRDEIKSALSGDIELMTRLMKEWDVDAQILESQGLIGIRKLNRNAFIRSQMIGRKIKEKDLELESQARSLIIFDDEGIPFQPSTTQQIFLPQTFVSASFLLALASPQEIAALPKGMRAQTHLYPKVLTDQIPLDTGRTNSEQLYRLRPGTAFVADYSHPATLEMLKNQGISLFTLKEMKTVDQVADAIARIGNVANHPLQAEVLSLFIESAMLAIDNRLIALLHDMDQHHEKPRVMFLNHYAQFSVPTDRTIAGDLLHRLHRLRYSLIPQQEVDAKFWSIPIDQEQIIHLNPDFLIIATNDQENLKKNIEKNPAFDAVNAKVNQRIHTIDYTTQAPTQYIVLTYYDIAQSLMRY